MSAQMETKPSQQQDEQHAPYADEELEEECQELLRPETMACVFDAIRTKQEGYPWVPLGDFQLDFYRNFPTHRAELIADPIEVHPHLPNVEASDEDKELYRWAVFCAASVEYLAHRYGLACPEWVSDPAYRSLPEPWYFAPTALQKPAVRERVEQQTPEEFIRRNIYCGQRMWVDKYAAAQELLRRTA